jgi:hypothetical protein
VATPNVKPTRPSIDATTPRGARPKDRRLGELVHCRRNCQNLLEPWGNFHGLQPYDFAALGFIRGPEKSPFGSVREIPIRGTVTKLVVHIDDVQVRSISAVAAGDHDDAEVTKLQVSVALRAKP